MSRRDGSGEALADEADELGGFGEESVTGLAGMGHQHMDYDNVQTATSGVHRQRRRTAGALDNRRWTCWCIGKKYREEGRRGQQYREEEEG
ncbi:hypothetical protein TIFTF001_055025 [Ficus carica]|uniref:Uncharacterized protein n=1 Tax=Ficus carica TaxID=3494 RepID=A0AA88EGP5_FICCA|nr:hypothetical protein TIFTF001_055025 [Ficus carica]